MMLQLHKMSYASLQVKKGSRCRTKHCLMLQDLASPCMHGTGCHPFSEFLSESAIQYELKHRWTRGRSRWGGPKPSGAQSSKYTLKHSLHNDVKQLGSTELLGKATKHTQLPSAQSYLVQLLLKHFTFCSSICLAAALSLRPSFPPSRNKKVENYNFVFTENTMYSEWK